MYLRGLMLATALLTMAIPTTQTLQAGEYNAVVDIGAPMPAFTGLPATDGTSLSSSDLTEQVVVLVFLANHCPWVKGMDPDLVKLGGAIQSDKVRIVGVSVNHREDDRLPAMKKHAAQAGYNFTYIYDESQELGRRLGATRTPEYYVFDKDRKLVYMGLLHDSPASKRRDGTINYTEGQPTEFYVAAAVQELLAGNEVSPAETRAHGCSVEYDQDEVQ